MALLPLHELRKLIADGPPFPRGLLRALRGDERAGARALYDACLRKLRLVRAETARLDSMALFDDSAVQPGLTRIAGVDEAGRGPLAGPIVAGAVVLGCRVDGLNDSKQLLPEEREALYDVLHDGSHAIGVGVVEVEELDRIGIQAANYAAMMRAVAALNPPPHFLLVDGFPIRGCPLPQRPVVKGDSLSLCIAAASIVAKVTRDRMMLELDRVYPQYGFASHKGYCTRQHLEALDRHGPCPIHRTSFGPVSQALLAGSLIDECVADMQEELWS
jgi:ribonuclease HII